VYTKGSSTRTSYAVPTLLVIADIGSVAIKKMLPKAVETNPRGLRKMASIIMSVESISEEAAKAGAAENSIIVTNKIDSIFFIDGLLF
jgi:hypothetical protein